MKDNNDDGGPAFPAPVCGNPGMTIRDYFAAKADPNQIYGTVGLPLGVAEALMGSKSPNCATEPVTNAVWWSQALAKWKVMHADHMLAARAKK